MNENKIDKNKNKKDLFKTSAVINFLLFLAGWIYRQIGRSIAAFIFTGYEKCEEIYKSSFFYTIFQGYKQGVIKNTVSSIKKQIIISCENSVFIKTVNNCFDKLLASKLYTTGAFLISFGFYSILMYLLQIFILGKPETLALDLIAGISLAVCGGLLVFSKQSVYHAIYGSKICNFVLFKFLGFSEKRDKSFSELLELNINTKGRNIVWFLIGMVLGTLTYFVSPVYICLAIAAVIVLYAVLCYPEAGFIALLFFVPFIPPGSLIVTGAGPCILVLVCYFLKLIRGKRTFNFEIFDLFVLMFCILIFFSGVVSVSSQSFRPALIYLCFTLVYFAGVNMIRSKEMILRCVAALAFSGFLVAAYGIYQNYFGGAETTWQDAAMFANISGRVASTFENPNVLAEYLIMIIPFLIAAIFLVKYMKERMPYVICLLFTGLCLVFTWSRGSWLAFIISGLVLFIILDKRVIAIYTAAAFAVPFAPFFLPEAVVSRFASIGNIADSSTSYRVSIWQGTVNMLKNHFFTGIGIGIEPFKLVYPEYALSGIESAPHSHSLYLQICVEHGILGLIIFAFAMFFFMQCCFTAVIKSVDRYLKLFAAAGLCAIGGFLLNGVTDFVWYNYRVYLIFWLIIAVTAGICRFALKNQPMTNEG